MKAQLTLHLPDHHTPLAFEALCVRNLGISTPASPVDGQATLPWQGLKLADPQFGTSGDIELLMGADVLPDILRAGLLRRCDLTAQRTAVGWTISGRASTAHTATQTSACLVLRSEIETPWHQQLMGALQRFWEVEEMPRSIRQSPEDEACERIFLEHRRETGGRYFVRLPVKPGALALLEDGLAGARVALRSLQRRMSQDSVLAAEYTRFMQEWPFALTSK
ncbi:uncharacterized protein LOC103315686 [Nasonia vitripennis]|uniref:Peptidase aspartic putative domain-containing protein n=1 Tax=Nasonia vitripennis TaxID=7425 RepID=A0A7M7H3G2_NASVI|nr:uncharacterized protein LOC103315686 [Nasonia vitripennis]